MKVEKLNESKRPLYVIKDSKGNQLSAPNPDDNELWDRVSDMEARGRRGLCVVAYTGEDVDEAYTFVGEPDPTGRLEGNIRWAQKYKTWQDVYQLFMDVAEKDLDDPSNVSTHVEELYARGKGLPQWDKAYRRWIEDDRDSTMESLTESHDDTVEFVMQIEDMIREVTPKIIDKAFGKSYSFDLDGEGSAEDAMDSFREAVHELAMAIYSMVVARREGYDESLNESTDNTADYTYHVSDIIAALPDNMPEDQIDKEVKLFTRINKKLGVTDSLFIIDSEGKFNPDYLDFDMIDDFDDEVYTVNGIKFYVEHNNNGKDYLYFRSEDDAKNYVDFVNKFYDEDMDEGILDTVKEIAPKVIDTIGKAPEAILSTIDKMHS